MSRVRSCPINYPHLQPPTPEQVAVYVDVFNPLVCMQPGTGRQNPFRYDISVGTAEGMHQEEGDALLRDLRDFSTHPQFTRCHNRKEGTALIPDNR